RPDRRPTQPAGRAERLPGQPDHLPAGQAGLRGPVRPDRAANPERPAATDPSAGELRDLPPAADLGRPAVREHPAPASRPAGRPAAAGTVAPPPRPAPERPAKP